MTLWYNIDMSQVDYVMQDSCHSEGPDSDRGRTPEKGLDNPSGSRKTLLPGDRSAVFCPLRAPYRAGEGSRIGFSEFSQIFILRDNVQCCLAVLPGK